MLTALPVIPAVVSAAEEAAEAHGGPSPWLIGGVAFGILMLLLLITTRFNAER